MVLYGEASRQANIKKAQELAKKIASKTGKTVTLTTTGGGSSTQEVSKVSSSGKVSRSKTVQLSAPSGSIAEKQNMIQTSAVSIQPQGAKRRTVYTDTKTGRTFQRQPGQSLNQALIQSRLQVQREQFEVLRQKAQNDAELRALNRASELAKQRIISATNRGEEIKFRDLLQAQTGLGKGVKLSSIDSKITSETLKTGKELERQKLLIKSSVIGQQKAQLKTELEKLNISKSEINDILKNYSVKTIETFVSLPSVQKAFSKISEKENKSLLANIKEILKSNLTKKSLKERLNKAVSEGFFKVTTPFRIKNKISEKGFKGGLKDLVNQNKYINKIKSLSPDEAKNILIENITSIFNGYKKFLLEDLPRSSEISKTNKQLKKDIIEFTVKSKRGELTNKDIVNASKKLDNYVIKNRNYKKDIYKSLRDADRIAAATTTLVIAASLVFPKISGGLVRVLKVKTGYDLVTNPTSESLANFTLLWGTELAFKGASKILNKVKFKIVNNPKNIKRDSNVIELTFNVKDNSFSYKKDGRLIRLAKNITSKLLKLYNQRLLKFFTPKKPKSKQLLIAYEEKKLLRSELYAPTKIDKVYAINPKKDWVKVRGFKGIKEFMRYNKLFNDYRNGNLSALKKLEILERGILSRRIRRNIPTVYKKFNEIRLGEKRIIFPDEIKLRVKTKKGMLSLKETTKIKELGFKSLKEMNRYNRLFKLSSSGDVNAFNELYNLDIKRLGRLAKIKSQIPVKKIKKTDIKKIALERFKKSQKLKLKQQKSIKTKPIKYGKYKDKYLYKGEVFSSRKKWIKAIKLDAKKNNISFDDVIKRLYNENKNFPQKINKQLKPKFEKLNESSPKKEINIKKENIVFEISNDKNKTIITKDGKLYKFRIIEKEVTTSTGQKIILKQEVLVETKTINKIKKLQLKQKLKTKVKQQQLQLKQKLKTKVKQQQLKQKLKTKSKVLIKSKFAKKRKFALAPLLKLNKNKTKYKQIKYKITIPKFKIKKIQDKVRKIQKIKEIPTKNIKNIPKKPKKKNNIKSPQKPKKFIKSSPSKPKPVEEEIKKPRIKIPKLEWEKKLPDGYTRVVNIYVKVGKNIKKLPIKTTPNRALKYVKRIIDNTTARSFQLKIVGVTKVKDIGKQSLNKFRKKKGRDPKVLFFVEKSKYSIDTKGEKTGLSIAKYLKKRKR